MLSPFPGSLTAAKRPGRARRLCTFSLSNNDRYCFYYFFLFLIIIIIFVYMSLICEASLRKMANSNRMWETSEHRFEYSSCMSCKYAPMRQRVFSVQPYTRNAAFIKVNQNERSKAAGLNLNRCHAKFRFINRGRSRDTL